MANVQMLDLSEARVVSPGGLSAREGRAVEMLLEEVEKRTRIRLRRVDTWPDSGAAIAVAAARLLDSFGGRLALDSDSQGGAAEGYHLRTQERPPLVAVIGNDERGVLYGIGRLLRALRMANGSMMIPVGLNESSAPAYRLRGHQIGYRDKVNSYDGWDLPQWEVSFRQACVGTALSSTFATWRSSAPTPSR